MADPSQQSTTPPQPAWIRFCQWLWKQRGLLWGTVIFGVGLNLIASWLITPSGALLYQTPLGIILGHPLFLALGGFGLLGLTAGLWIVNRRYPAPLSQQISPRFPPEVEQKNRKALLKRVRTTWIEGLLERSLHEAARLELRLQERPDVLANPWRLQVQELDRPPQALPAGTPIVEVYDEANGELLILGEPGAGKTTLLLELARTLLDRAQVDEQHRIPVVFNLSSWAKKRPILGDWLVEELSIRYQVPHRFGQSWVNKDQLLLLLDGLDEVAPASRHECIGAINTFRQTHPLVQMVVCSRSTDYLNQPTQLRLQTAVVIQPLTQGQIDAYLESTGEQATALRELLLGDADLRELVTTPLMLTVLVFAFREDSLEKVSMLATFEAKRGQVFTSYVQHMLKRRGASKHYTSQQIRHWLAYLAEQMKQRSQMVFFHEQMQPDWLEDRHRRLLYRWSVGLGAGLASGLFFGLSIWLGVGLSFGLGVGSLALLRVGLLIGLPVGLVVGLGTKRQPAEFLAWSVAKPIRALFGMAFLGLLVGGPVVELLVGGPVVELFFRLVGGLSIGLFPGLVYELVSGFSGGELLTGYEGRRLKLGGLSIGLFLGLLVGLVYRLGNGLVVGLDFVLVVGLGAWLGVGLLLGLRAAMQHYILRFWLWRADSLPWNLITFLDEAAERLLLRKVGGSYIFVHRLLLDYFASFAPQAAYRQASRHTDMTPESQRRRGGQPPEQGDVEEARAAYQQAIASGHAPKAVFSLGRLLERQGDVRGAKKAYQQAIASGHADYAPVAAFSLGNLLERQGHVEGAEASYRQAIASGHAEVAPEAAIILGELLEKQGDLEGAKTVYQWVIASGHPEWAPQAALHLRELREKQDDGL
jgi:DNA polymerase III delta prime subunit